MEKRDPVQITPQKNGQEVWLHPKCHIKNDEFVLNCSKQ